jgi:hypothetical protein
VRLQNSLKNQLLSLDDIVIQVQIVDVLFEEQKGEFAKIKIALNTTSEEIKVKLTEIIAFNQAIRNSKTQFDKDKIALENDINLFRADLIELKSSVDQVDIVKLEEFDASVAQEFLSVKSKNKSSD